MEHSMEEENLDIGPGKRIEIPERKKEDTYVHVRIEDGNIKVTFNGNILTLRGLLKFADDRIRESMENQQASPRLKEQSMCGHLTIKGIPADGEPAVCADCGFTFPDHSKEKIDEGSGD